ncbi:RNA-binding transcriptional accessory protein [Hornefia porci]|uniref:RNA-binding transcriptional accessory protein n=1 Tax=Hornefia porci TaxID=2652292 RepID=A0A1Q9JJB3_9FIRM|nr:Tex family protein [Hornefia porci]OLR56245.1 RNA-binding transcriptional accessory protein [Hornefia porci]
MDIVKVLAEEFHIRPSQVESTIKLIDDGNTIPFIARYRKEATGGLTDVTLRDMAERLEYLRNLQERKEEVKRLIGEQGKLTEELSAEIDRAEVLQRVEDLYKPYRQKKATRAGKARARGLEPLAMILYAQQQTKGDPETVAQDFVNPEKEVASPAEALQGACDIIAEMIADDADLTEAIRDKTFRAGKLVTEAVNPEEKSVYDMYYDSSEGIARIPNHRILAINRGEKEKLLKVRVETDTDRIIGLIEKQTIRNRRSIFVPLLEQTVADAYKRLIAPSVEREVRKTLTERAEREAVRVFAKNTENLLMVPPVKDKRVISIDPGYRTGCKVAALDGTGKLRAYATIYPTQPRNDVAGAERTLLRLIDKYGCDIIVIGNGTASRETEEVVANFIRKNSLPIQYTIVNEAGASVYSASKLASEEYPDLDVTTRGAMSLGRRLQDPLAELVKIDPKHIGVGQYQHDINQKMLESALTGVVENCVNRVGVDLNTASPSLLSYVAGINMGIARNIAAWREENGRFTNRRQLLKVSRLGAGAFEQCAGFLRIADGDQPLDRTAVHPESYKVAEAMMNKIGIDDSAIAAGGVGDALDERIAAAYPAKKLSRSIDQMAEDLGVGKPTLLDIIEELKKPGRDPRDSAPPVVFRNDVRDFDDLKEGMELTGTVRNVVDFGAFVDIGVKQDGLVHISQLSSKYVSHPMDVVSVGDTVKVRILSVDKAKKKISLTMKL